MAGKRRAGLAALCLPVVVALGYPASAGAVSPAADFELPQRWNDDYAPGSHCATPGFMGTYVSAQRRWFKQTDATSVANNTDGPVPVSHTVTQARTQTIEVGAGITGEGELAKVLTQTYGFNYVSEQHWKLKQKVGPYTLPPQSQGQLVWGFTMLDVDAQDVRCSTDQVWEPTGKPYQASAPEAKYSELRLGDAPDWA